MNGRGIAALLLVLGTASFVTLSFPTAQTSVARGDDAAAEATTFSVRMPIDPVDTARNAYGIWPFGVHGGGHAADGHPGWDVEYRSGASIRAAADGTVANLFQEAEATTFTLAIDHRVGSQTYRTDYTNIGVVAAGVTPGATVTAGQPIGTAACRSQVVGTVPTTFCMTHFQTDDFTKNEGLTNPFAVSPETVLNAEGRAVFDVIWAKATYSQELVEPFVTNPRNARFPMSRTWTLQSGGLPARLDFRRVTTAGNDYEYTLRNAGGTSVEAGTLTIEPLATPLATIDLHPTGGALARLGVYDIVSGIMQIRLGSPGGARAGSLAGASIYTTSKPGGSVPPFGGVDTPAPGATGVTGSLSVTGWTLDDVGVAGVRILRDPVGAEPAGSKVLLGNAVLVADARPDIAAAYPALPAKDRAGWGYLLLTNMLPGQGNGSYTLYVYADDADGGSTLLGTRTIVCANATATKPFGAIDTPDQGATISGSAYTNFGWALTPLPKTISADGSTIAAYIDGEKIGSVTYNNFRADIATLFPGLANSNGAVGFLTINTTDYDNGVHTIAWVVTDSAGAAEGIGSRYFTIQNGTSLVARSIAAEEPEGGPHDARSLGTARMFSRTGFDERRAWTMTEPGRDRVRRVMALELSRVQLHIEGVVTGYLRVGREPHPLPVGSTLNVRQGLFSWQPGPGFIGAYEMVFSTAAGDWVEVTVTLEPVDH